MLDLDEPIVQRNFARPCPFTFPLLRMEIHCAYDQLVQVADLKPHPKNPNTHSAAQVAAIAAVIEGKGWRAPITVSNRSGLITRGHGRLQAALLLGCEQAAADFQDYASDQTDPAHTPA